jgi:hypothetical protein
MKYAIQSDSLYELMAHAIGKGDSASQAFKSFVLDLIMFLLCFI